MSSKLPDDFNFYPELPDHISGLLNGLARLEPLDAHRTLTEFVKDECDELVCNLMCNDHHEQAGRLLMAMSAFMSAFESACLFRVEPDYPDDKEGEEWKED